MNRKSIARVTATAAALILMFACGTNPGSTVRAQSSNVDQAVSIAVDEAK